MVLVGFGFRNSHPSKGVKGWGSLAWEVKVPTLNVANYATFKDGAPSASFSTRAMPEVWSEVPCPI